jgi:Protein of unknown function (DUF3499)
MGRLCERPGCSDVAAMAFGFDADRLLVWLAPREPDSDRMRAGALCKRHADAMVVPRGWTLDDRRETGPRLFRPEDAAAPPDRPRSRRARPDSDEGAEQLPLTVAEVTGEPLADEDPDATVAIPWMPTFDEADDLGGVLAARSPLLARAFRGTDRRR